MGVINMKKKSRIIFVCLGIFSLLLFFSIAYAQPFHNDWKKERGRRKGFDTELIEKLGLTFEQQEQLKKLRTVHREEMGETIKTLRYKRFELFQELEKPESDKKKITNLVTEVKTLQGKLLDIRVDNILKMKGILTPEQYKKLHSYNNRKKRMKDFLKVFRRRRSVELNQ
jgi:Spy/CpxP family protein refolding chaperone